MKAIFMIAAAILVFFTVFILCGEDKAYNKKYLVWNIPNVEKLEVCRPDPYLWIIPHWGDCKIVDVQSLIEFVMIIGEEIPKPSPTPTLTPTESTFHPYPLRPME